MCQGCGSGGRGGAEARLDAALARAAEAQVGRSILSRRALLRLGLGLAALPAGWLLPACATVPVTGRSQLRLISEEEEARIGVAAFRQLQQEERKKRRLLEERDDPANHAWVRRVLDRVLPASGLAGAYRWEHMLIDAPKTVNAAAIAGGRVIVYTGILPVARDDAGLSAILGHEVGHVMAHHTAERVSQGMLVNTAAAAAGAAGVGELTMAALGLGVQVGVLLPYGRSQESEADYLGLLLMAKAGYDPRESVALWRRMAASTGEAGRGPEFLSTHPDPQTRIQSLEGWMPQAWRYYQDPRLPLPSPR